MKDFISEIIKRVRAEQNSLADTLTTSMNVNSYEDYQRLVGRYEGLKLTLDIVNEILREDEEE
jgi:GH35 family endo-1,4-beta-xylanase